jgi:hypothetical protein
MGWGGQSRWKLGTGHERNLETDMKNEMNYAYQIYWGKDIKVF